MSLFKDLSKQKFGRLTALLPKKIDRRTYWECVCECGKNKTVVIDSLTSGRIKSCGCLRSESSSRKLKDLTNKKFNMITAISPIRTGGKAKWNCICDCGNKLIVFTDNLTSGHTKSCGCRPNKGNYKHGHSLGGNRGTKTYRAWASMIQRCYQKSFIGYKRYGGRGIKVCDRWKNSFENFLADMGNPPTKKHSLDRIKTDGNYEPSNCRWATSKEQSSNKSNNHMIKWNGETKTITEWSRVVGVNRVTLLARIKCGWDINKILTTPTRGK